MGVCVSWVVGNNEYKSTNYTVIVELQRVEAVDGNLTATNGTENGTEIRVVDRERLDELSAQLAHNETWQEAHELTPPMTRENLRVQYLLYRGEPPAEPMRENAYRSLHLWMCTKTNVRLLRNSQTCSDKLKFASQFRLPVLIIS